MKLAFKLSKLDCKDTDSVFCYVNSVFAPGLDEGMGGLWRVSFNSTVDNRFELLRSANLEHPIFQNRG
jgi:hypothetical protein